MTGWKADPHDRQMWWKSPSRTDQHVTPRSLKSQSGSKQAMTVPNSAAYNQNRSLGFRAFEESLNFRSLPRLRKFAAALDSDPQCSPLNSGPRLGSFS